MTKEVYVQVGVTALRSPMGEPLPAVPIYIKQSQLKSSGLTQVEEDLMHDVSGLFIEKHKEQQSKPQNGGVKCQNIKK